MATNPRLPPPPSQNHVITAPPKGVVGGNRKKQKRRAKQAAKAAADPSVPLAGDEPAELDYDEDPLGYGDEDDYEYSDAEHYQDQYALSHPTANGYSVQPGASKKKKKKKGKGGDAHPLSPYNPELAGNSMPQLPHRPPPPLGALRADPKAVAVDIWNTSTQQERHNIKQFWLGLSEDERKSLLKIEKEAVLRKMKQQQKHACSCTVCGRKRTAIEEELEVLYEGYYEELEQYAHHDHPPNLSPDGVMPGPLHHRHPLAESPPSNPHHKTSNLHEHLDDEEYSEDDEEYSEDEEDYSDDALPSPLRDRSAVPDFFSFGQNLTVKDNILTVADDLLKNDGRKFIEMMEQLAERRMQRESEAEYAAANPNRPDAYSGGDSPYAHDDPLGAGDEYDDDEASYDSQEEYDDELDEEDEMGGMTEEQRMQEGRRMFQIFAARMFEQRVLTAYKEKVAAERQQKLLAELEDESKLEAEREAKKQRDAQKKKDKKKQQQAAKAEEKAKKEAEKAAEEARLREAEEKKQEEQRRKKEEQRRKREEEKRKQDEERARKEAEKNRRQQEEQQRREETERKSREQKAAEKAKKDEARKREREEREAKEKEARDRKAQEEKQKSDLQAKAKAKTEREAKDREKPPQQPAAPSAAAPSQQQPAKRPSQPSMVAVPGVQPRQNPSGTASPHLAVATPVMPKASTAATARQRQPSQQNSIASSPKQSQSQVSSAPSKSSSPSSGPSVQLPPAYPPGNMGQKAGNQQLGQQPQHPMPTVSPPSQLPLQPPPGMSHPQQHPGVFGVPSNAMYPPFQGPQGQMMHPNMVPRSPMPMYPHQGQHMGMQNGRFGPPGAPGQPQPTVAPPQARTSFSFDVSPNSASMPSNYGQSQQHQQRQATQPTSPGYQPAATAAPSVDTQQRSAMHSHSRQASRTERSPFESTVGQPIARPAPIQRPSSVKPQEGDVDDLSKHLGSSALLDDSDEPIPQGMAENRRQSNIAPGARTSVSGMPPGMAPIGFGGSGSFGAPSTSWSSPTLPFGQNSSGGQQGWGGLSAPGIGGWSNNNNAGFPNGGFGSIGGNSLHRPSGAGANRPLTIRQAICQACRQLSTSGRGSADGYHEVTQVLRQMDANRVPLDVPPALREIEDICETEGDAQNGGGELHVRHMGPGKSFAIMWQPLAGTPDQGRGMGEIGSPVPSKASPVGAGWGAAPGLGRAPSGFQNLGAAVGSSPTGGPG